MRDRPANRPDPHAGRAWLVGGLVGLVVAVLPGFDPAVRFVLGVPPAAALYGFLLRRAGVPESTTALGVAAQLAIMVLICPVGPSLVVFLAISSGATTYIMLAIRGRRAAVVGLVAVIGTSLALATAIGPARLPAVIFFALAVVATLSAPGRRRFDRTAEIAPTDRSRRRA